MGRLPEVGDHIICSEFPPMTIVQIYQHRLVLALDLHGDEWIVRLGNDAVLEGEPCPLFDLDS